MQRQRQTQKAKSTNSKWKPVLEFQLTAFLKNVETVKPVLLGKTKSVIECKIWVIMWVENINFSASCTEVDRKLA